MTAKGGQHSPPHIPGEGEGEGTALVAPALAGIGQKSRLKPVLRAPSGNALVEIAHERCSATGSRWSSGWSMTASCCGSAGGPPRRRPAGTRKGGGPTGSCRRASRWTRRTSLPRPALTSARWSAILLPPRGEARRRRNGRRLAIAALVVLAASGSLVAVVANRMRHAADEAKAAMAVQKNAAEEARQLADQQRREADRQRQIAQFANRRGSAAATDRGETKKPGGGPATRGGPAAADCRETTKPGGRSPT